jgi:hypothetical protein
MVKTETRMVNESGYIFLLLNGEDQVIGAFHRVETACESVRMSFANDEVVRLDDRDVGLTSYAVILRDPCNGGEEEYHGCILKQPVSQIACGFTL